MIAAWMLWSAGIGVLFLIAGLAAERLLTVYGRPTRWVWIVAGAATTALSVLRLPGGTPEQAAPPPGYAPPLLEPLAVTVARDSLLRSLDDLLVLGWVVLSSLLVVTVLFAFARLVREGRSWQPGSLGHRTVLWSRDTGPTIVGLLRPRVVLPAWVRAIGSDEQRLILAHEEEHIRAGDARLRFLMTLPLFVFPWNPALWLQRHRLNLAVELDCDRRVIRRMPGRRHAYGNLLLRVGAGRNGLHRLALVSLSEGRSQLERRIRRLVEKMPRARRIQASLLLLGAAAVVTLAVLFPRIRGEGGPVSDELVDLMAEPTPTPYTVRPDLVNEREVMQALQAEYPPELRDTGIAGTANVHFFIDTEGVVQRVLIAGTSGHEELDSAALRVARVFRFTPALDMDELVPVWIAIPITFTTRAAASDGTAPVPEELRQVFDSIFRGQVDDPGDLPADLPEELKEIANRILRERAADPGNRPADSDVPQEASLADAPTFTPYTVRPNLLNEGEVQRALEREFPPILRDAGIGGTVNVYFFIDAEGVVQQVLVAQPSGHEALDEAALRVARVFRFTPALNEDAVVPVWITIPITFQTRELRDDLQLAARQTRDAQAQAADQQVRVAAPSELPPADLGREPMTPRYTVRPDLAPREVQRALEREYPPGHATLDEAALRVANVFQFTPALNLDEPAPGAPVADTPTATLYTVPPNLINEEEVQQAIDDEYPALLRDARIGGTVHVQIFVDVAGVVQNAVVGRSSGHDPLDEAALRAARVMRFTPALDVDEPVPVWIAIPITFIADGRMYRMAEGDISRSP